ncbi:MAG: nucleotidyltransferase family protein [Gammaproteobacteria bacterium]|jgi:N-acetyl-alpha-D-muramate 1-phosphate uridylyltransferase|nr:nucleotidyltransferase family protein [Gammaproteobacteria bacterium]MBT4494811.1 nucleotidyltransferase family protein [Gammaproteobacteria bacterium]
MRAMLLAAGLGKRLRPLTNSLPKPLLVAGGRTLIEHQLVRLAAAGITEIVVNLHHLADQISEKLGDGAAYGVAIEYSQEPVLLETGGGFKEALSILGEDPVAVVSADTYIDFDFASLPESLPEGCLGCLVMTENPLHHPEGDFSMAKDGVLGTESDTCTYTGVGVLSPEIVRHVEDDIFKLRRVFDEAIASGRLIGIQHDGYWCDVGTEERYLDLQKHLSTREGRQ